MCGGSKAKTVVTIQLSAQVRLVLPWSALATLAGICRFAPPQTARRVRSRLSIIILLSARAVKFNPNLQDQENLQYFYSINIQVTSPYFTINLEQESGAIAEGLAAFHCTKGQVMLNKDFWFVQGAVQQCGRQRCYQLFRTDTLEGRVKSRLP